MSPEMSTGSTRQDRWDKSRRCRDKSRRCHLRPNAIHERVNLWRTQSIKETIHGRVNPYIIWNSSCYESVHAIDTQFNLEYQFPTTRPRPALPKCEASVGVKLIVATLSVATLKVWSPSWRPFQRGESQATETQCLNGDRFCEAQSRRPSLWSQDYDPISEHVRNQDSIAEAQPQWNTILLGERDFSHSIML